MPPLLYQIIPLRRVPPSLGLLDYALPVQADAPKLGEIVRIPFGTNTIHGIVFRQGASVTKKTFVPKELIREQHPAFLTPEQLALLGWLHDEALAPLPTIALGMVPAKIASEARPPAARIVHAVTAPLLEEREDVIAQFARQNAQPGLTLVHVPAIRYATAWTQAFGAQCAVVQGKQTAAAKAATLQGKHKLIITTQAGIFLPFTNLKHVIIDQADDEGYFAFDQVPRVDMRKCARELAFAHGAALTLIARWQSPTLQGLFPSAQWRGTDKYPWVIIDRTGEAGEQRRAIIAAGLRERLGTGRTLWLVNRRGEAGQLRCQDCEHIVACPTCARPLQVIKQQNESMLFCPYDNLRTVFPETCAFCKSPKLALQSKGTTAIAHALQQELQQPVACTDARTPLLPTEAQHVVATTAIANYTDQRFDRIVIARTESFFATGHYRGTEEFLGALALARQHGRGSAELYCQTFSPQAAELQDMAGAIAQETRDRTLATYPPFGTLVVLQPRLRATRLAPSPLRNEIGFTITPLRNNVYVIRVPQTKRRELLRALQKNLHDSWEAIVDPPRIPND